MLPFCSYWVGLSFVNQCRDEDHNHDSQSIKTAVWIDLFFAVLQLPTNMRGGNGKVAYIDTEGTLYP